MKLITTPQPILVTGMPRSGTTWLARLLATAPNTAMTGREPMNPQPGQYALNGTVQGWTRIKRPTEAQTRALKRAYRGLALRTFGRYGRRQLMAPLPWTRIVVKDPYAALSASAVRAATGGRVVFVYRHPGAVLDSYQRMGWRADVTQLAPIFAAHSPRLAKKPPHEPLSVSLSWMWNGFHSIALSELRRCPRPIIVSHKELALGGANAARMLFEHLGLTWSDTITRRISGHHRFVRSASTSLHQHLAQDPARVAVAWRTRVSAQDATVIESRTASIFEELEGRRLKVA